MRWLVTAILLLSGCTSITTRPPEQLRFWDIRFEPYEIHVYDCTNKSSKYARILREAGYEADIWLCDVWEGGKSYGHAIVSVKMRNGKTLWCDVTNGTWSWDSEDLGELYLRIPYETRLDEDLWGKSFIEEMPN